MVKLYSQAPVELMRMPWPYRSMLAVCSDIDGTSLRMFDALHRFLNTNELTPMGRGVGLDISDSMWFYGPPSQQRDSADSLMTVFDGYTPERRSPFADRILSYVRCGWIDTLHSYGNFSRVSDPAQGFRREYAEAALMLLSTEGAPIRVWVNHGNKYNTQNIGHMSFMQGDVEGSAAYHSDLLCEYGCEFYWSGKQRAEFSKQSVLESTSLKDGRRVWTFDRFDLAPAEDAVAVARRHGSIAYTNPKNPSVLAWHPQLLDYQLREENLRSLVSQQGFAILGQHFGMSRPLRRFGQPALRGFRRLKAFQDKREILVARTSRLLNYARVREHMEYSTVQGPEKTLRIDVSGIHDPNCGHFVPTIDFLRGITFRVRSERPVELWLQGRERVPEDLLTRAFPKAGEQIIGIKWFPADTRDYSQESDCGSHGSTNQQEHEHMARSNQTVPSGEEIVKWLDTQRDARPPHMDQKKYDYALDYCKGRYAIGLDHYRNIFHAMGGVGNKMKGLDIGSGAGHWAMAFALENGIAEGIDIGEDFVTLANRIAEKFGYSDRVKHRIGRAENLEYDDETFHFVWSHGVLMYCDTERTFREISRVLRPGRFFYCGYSSTGFRVSGIYTAVTQGKAVAARAQLANFVGSRLQREGIPHPPWSRLRALTLDELVEVCRVVGLKYADEPGLQDGLRDFAGIPGTIDVLVKKVGGPDAGMLEMTAGGMSQAERLARYDELLKLGFGDMVARCLTELGEDFDQEAIRSIALRAEVRADRGGESLAADLATRGVEAKARGLYDLDRRQYAQAAEAFAQLPETDVDRAFLRGTALMAAKDDKAAHAELCRGVEQRLRPADCVAALMLQRAADSDSVGPEMKAMLVDFLEALPESYAASPEGIEKRLMAI